LSAAPEPGDDRLHVPEVRGRACPRAETSPRRSAATASSSATGSGRARRVAPPGHHPGWCCSTYARFSADGCGTGHQPCPPSIAAQQLTRSGSGAEPRMCALTPRAKKKQQAPAPWRPPVRFGRSSPGWRWCWRWCPVCSMPPVSGAFPAPHSLTRPQLSV